MAAFQMTRTGWIWLFVVLIVLIFVVVFTVKAKAQSPNKGNGIKGNSGGGNSGGGGDSNIITNITGGYCAGLSKDDIKSLQAAVNKKGCRDSQGNSLKEDGVFGPLSFSATINCIK